VPEVTHTFYSLTVRFAAKCGRIRNLAQEEGFAPVQRFQNDSGPAFEREFSKFVESQKQSVVDALLQAGYTKKDFTNWVILFL